MDKKEVLAVSPNDAEADELIRKFIEYAQKLKESFAAMALIAARFSPAQLQKLKTAVRGIVSSSRIDCLALMGHGLMAEHLALKEKPLSAKLFMRLSKDTREKLNTKGFPLEVLTSTGAVLKPVENCSTYEIIRAVDEKKGILSAVNQVDRLKKIVSAPTAVAEYEECDKIFPHGNLLVIFGKDGSRIGVPFSMLRQFVK